MRGRGLLASALAAILLTVPLASADDGLLTRGTVSYGFDILGGAMVERDMQIPLAPNPVVNQCSAQGVLETDDQTGGFRFAESDTETACAEALFVIPVPAGATALEVRFTAERVIEMGEVPLAVDATQNVRFYNQTGGFLASSEYISASHGSLEAPMDVFHAFSIPAGNEHVTLGWFFHDHGATTGQRLGLLTSGQAFSAAVYGIQIEFPHVPVVGHRHESYATTPGQDLVQHAATVGVHVPDPQAPGARTNVTLHIGATHELTRLTAPDGTDIPLSTIPPPQRGAELVITIPTQVIEANYGWYSLRFNSTSPAPLLALPPGPATVPWLPWMTGGVPVLALTLAFPALGLRRSRSMAARFAWRNMWAIVVVACLVCIAAAAVAWTALPQDALTTIPAPAGALAIHAQWVGAGIVILAVAILGARQIRRAMADENDRERSEREAMGRINKELERFAYVASHDLQEPLRKVISITQLVQSRYKGRLDQEADDFLGYAADSAERMRNLVQDLLRYSRLDNEPVVSKRINVAQTVRAVRADLQEMLQDSGGTVEETTMPDLAGHAGQFRQVMQNLISNGIKYRDPGRAPCVHVSGVAEGPMTHIRITDNGIGIEARHQARIFEIFQRLHSQHEYSGTGIGLSLVRKIVERHGGQVWVESAVGQGSCFHILWPTWGRP